MKISDKRKTKGLKGFTFAEVLITLSLFLILSSLGVGAYFRYYSLSLINRDVSLIRTALHETRFKAMKNPHHSNYGLHLDTVNDAVVTYRDTYVPGAAENIVVNLEQLEISDLDLQPDPGVTSSILFENKTGKTSNDGTFTVSSNNQNFDFGINSQGALE